MGTGEIKWVWEMRDYEIGVGLGWRGDEKTGELELGLGEERLRA